MSIIKLKNVSKFYQNKKSIASGFNKINLSLDMGEFIVITGESGSGKSTLLNVISGLDSYEEGEMYINGEETSHYTEEDYEDYRRKYIGNIFQHFNLINSYTVYQNIELALLLNGYKKEEIKSKILEIIKVVGLEKQKNTKASKLSGGQKQRVAIARALAKDTPIIVADEPTGNLDVESAKSILKLLHDISRDKLVVVVTHNYEQIEKYATRKITMNDGKIIEDKKLVKIDEVQNFEKKYGFISNLSIFKLGFRNAFNIPSKLILLLLVYFFLTVSVFSEYSNLSKIKYEQDSYGYNMHLKDTSPNRIIINKKDKTYFSDLELDSISKMEEIDRVFKNDVMIDSDYYIYNDDMYYSGVVKSVSELETIDDGRMPTTDNEIVIEIDKTEFYIHSRDDLYNSVFKLQSTGIVNIRDDLKIVGIKYLTYDSGNIYSDYQTNFYMTEGLLNSIRKTTNYSYSDLLVNLNNKEFSQGEYGLYYSILPTSKLKSGEVLVPETFNTICDNYDCTNKNMVLSIKNIYYEDSIDLRVKNYITRDNYKSLTGLNDYYSDYIFMNNEDYEKLFVRNTYQISAYLKDAKKVDEFVEKLSGLGYNCITVRSTLTNDLESIMGIINIIRSFSFIISTIALVFISYFIIKLVFKSRNIYYSTIRILGATKNNAKSLLNVELLLDINMTYLLFIILIIICKFGLINSAYLKDIVTYFNLIDYIIVYLLLTVMSLIISNRYASKLFKDSAMKTYREEV